MRANHNPLKLAFAPYAILWRTGFEIQIDANHIMIAHNEKKISSFIVVAMIRKLLLPTSRWKVEVQKDSNKSHANSIVSVGLCDEMKLEFTHPTIYVFTICFVCY